MSYKYFVPVNKNNPWDDYWIKTEIKQEINSCLDDELLMIIKRHLDKNHKILDAGCGLGRWIIYLSNLGFKVSGVDNFDKAVLRLKKYDSKLDVRKADICNLPFSDNLFSGYLSFGVVEHLEEGPQKALEEAKRVLKKGGLIILETPYDNPLRRIIRNISIFKGNIKRLIYKLLKKNLTKSLKLQFYEYRYRNNELREYLKKLDFKILSSYPKDLISSKESIGLWSDFPSLRLNINQPFGLNSSGEMIKRLFMPFKTLFAGCTIVVAQKQ